MLQSKLINKYLVPILISSSLLDAFAKLRKATISFAL